MKNKYLFPSIRNFLNRLSKTKYFTKLNIVAVFNKIHLIENENEKTFSLLNMAFSNF